MSDTYAICDIFHSIQGEATHTGLPMVFIRFSGCPLRCSWCDEPLHRQADKAEHLTLTQLRSRILELAPHTTNLLLTGGEPLMAPHLDRLVDYFKDQGYWIAMETCGEGGEIPAEVDWVTLSPKNQLPQSLYERADEVKLVLGADADQSDKERLTQCHHPNLWLQPRALPTGPDPMAVALCYRWALESGGAWRLSLQTHKYIGVP
ncbi:Radical SAM domain protein [Magnetococcus marinus MC-1]|uniref:7-carboxy-7-deazaguanine synthase n=1 Tax=Magnetococcus marinus (strain ATCC BAA-1437 / JCM 17883 / MC-1) TaxID=156889 RepID=A0L5B2_MAGMM|nr:7-carboxy-7-deazaguanine synthase QueE [Magnetococcus marinus]ABK43155.1 Radical SAM domain protein [Magnetococcus marinus MC-1]